MPVYSKYNGSPSIGPTPPFDFGDLTNALINNGQMVLPPQAVERLGTIAGYDPSFNNGASIGQSVATSQPVPTVYNTSSSENTNSSTLVTGTYPAVSVFLAGDNVAIHGCRFEHNYTPVMNQAVRCLVYGTEVYVVGAAAGNTTNIVTGTTTNPDGTTTPVKQTVVIGGTPTIAGTKNFYLDYTYGYGSGTNTLPASVITQFLPNRMYTATLTARFKINSCAGDHTSISFSLTGPTGSETIWSNNHAVDTPSGGAVEYINGVSSPTYDSPPNLKAGEWAKQYPHNQFSWTIAVLAQNQTSSGSGYIGNPVPNIVFTKDTSPNLSITIYDHGPVTGQ